MWQLVRIILCLSSIVWLVATWNYFLLALPTTRTHFQHEKFTLKMLRNATSPQRIVLTGGVSALTEPWPRQNVCVHARVSFVSEVGACPKNLDYSRYRRIQESRSVIRGRWGPEPSIWEVFRVVCCPWLRFCHVIHHIYMSSRPDNSQNHLTEW